MNVARSSLLMLQSKLNIFPESPVFLPNGRFYRRFTAQEMMRRRCQRRFCAQAIITTAIWKWVQPVTLEPLDS